MAFDYTSAANVFAYGSSLGTSVSPVNEATVMASLITGASREVDQYCHQAFSTATYSAQSLRGVIDQTGMLTCYPAVPTMTTPTAIDWKLGTAPTWNAIDVSDSSYIDVQTSNSGSTVRLLRPALAGYRTARLWVRLSYTGGWANLAGVPSDFEWIMRRLCWWLYQQRSAPISTTAAPEFGQVTIPPGSWPRDIKDALRPYVKVVF